MNAPFQDPDDRGSPLADVLAAIEAEEAVSRRRARRSIAIVLVALVAGGLVWGFVLRSPSLDELIEVDPALRRGIDLAAVNVQLFPNYMIAQANSDSRQNDEQIGEHFAALREAIGVDPNLTRWLDELERLRGEPSDSAPQAMLEVFDWWNGYVQQWDRSFLMDATIYGQPRRWWFTARFYRVIYDDLAEAGGQSIRLRLVRRADRTNIVELFLGESLRGGDSRVQIDRVAEFAFEDLWPILSRNDDPLSQQVNAELARGLDAQSLEVLRQTAAARAELMAAVEAVRARSGCSNFVVNRVPWNGFTAAEVAGFQRIAQNAAYASCPAVSPAEATVLADASQRLAATPGLDVALEGLLAMAARAVAVHEVQHGRDEQTAAPLRPVCSGCAWFGERAVLELSAYLSSFADPDTGSIAFLQACTIEPDAPSAYAEALARLFQALSPEGCWSLRDGELPLHARGLEREWFDREHAIQLPPTFPTALALEPDGF